MPAPIPAPIPGRPLYVPYQGGRLYVSVHDRFYLEVHRGFKRQIRATHPDVNHRSWAAGRTRKLLRERERWEERERLWYARFGLDPPTRSSRPTVGRNGRARQAMARISCPPPYNPWFLLCVFSIVSLVALAFVVLRGYPILSRHLTTAGASSAFRVFQDPFQRTGT